jgi:hypothetical protein
MTERTSTSTLATKFSQPTLLRSFARRTPGSEGEQDARDDEDQGNRIVVGKNGPNTEPRIEKSDDLRRKQGCARIPQELQENSENDESEGEHRCAAPVPANSEARDELWRDLLLGEFGAEVFRAQHRVSKVLATITIIAVTVRPSVTRTRFTMAAPGPTRNWRSGALPLPE